MSNEQSKKRPASIDESTSSEPLAKKLTVSPAQNNNVDDVNEMVHGDNHQKPTDVKPIESRKLPDEILQKVYNETGGKLLIAGNVTWDLAGKTGMRNELTTFHRFTDEKYRTIASSSSSAHSLLIDMNGKVFSFGRNQTGQCGHKELRTINAPKLIADLSHLNIIEAATGSKHSLFLTDAGTVYACGENKNGQLGIETKKAKDGIVTKPTRINYSGAPIVRVECGGEFSAILDIEGNLHTFGLPEFGQLGHNTDGKYFITSTKLAFNTVNSPKLVSMFIEKSKNGRITPISNVKIVDFACGKHHTIAIDAEKRVFSFGFGGYGRLGHNEQKDEWMPRLIQYMNARITGGGIQVFCGAKFNLVISGHNNPYLFGRNKDTAAGNAQMYPKVVDALCGFNIKSVGCSTTSIVLACDNGKLIAWGASPTHGELGIGNDPKSSTQPIFVEYMDGVDVSKVTMGLEHTLLLVNTDDNTSQQKYDSLPEFIPVEKK